MRFLETQREEGNRFCLLVDRKISPLRDRKCGKIFARRGEIGMGSESKSRNDGGGDGIPEAAKKVVQSVKEIVNCTEQEIYAVLKECDMDPNLAVERLLAQDTFHEVRSKRERRKEMKEALDSRTRGNGMGLSRGGKIGIGNDRSVEQSGLANVTYNEQGKDVDNPGAGSVCASVTSSTTHVVGKNSEIDSFNTDDGRQSLGSSDSMSDTAQVSPGPQPLLIGVSKGHLSMADIVRMGRASQDAVSPNHCNSSGVSSSGNLESSSSLHSQNNSEQQVVHDEWPVIEQPNTGNAHALNMSTSSNANGPLEHPNLHVTAVSLDRNCELDAAQVSWEEIASDSAISEKTESSSISNKRGIMSRNTGLGLHSNSNLKNTPTSDFRSSYEHHEDVSSVALDLQHLSMRESKLEVPSSEDNSLVILPNHVQALGAKCSHLSFGTYKGGTDSASSAIPASNHLSRSGLEEKSAAVDDSLAQFPDASFVSHGDEQLGFDSLNHGDEQLGCDVLRGTSGDQNYDFVSSPWQELVKHIVSEETFGHEYSTTASIPDPSLQNSHRVTPSLPLKQPGLQSGSHSSFPRELHNDSNSMPHDVLAFLASQSQRARYINGESSINNFATSMSEVMEPRTFALHNRSAPTQAFAAQSKIHLQQSPDMEGYHSLPQNQSYMTTINSQRAFSDNPAYNQYPADMNYNLPQNKNEFLMSRLPPATAGDSCGYGNLGSSLCSPGSFMSNPSLVNTKPSSNFNEILPSQYIGGGRNLSSIQQHGNFPQWDYGTESRSSFLPERTQQHTFIGQPSQASLSQHVIPGYSDFYHSRAPFSEDLKQSGGFQDLSPKQLHQFWKHSH